MISVLYFVSTLVLARAAIPACNGPVVFNPPKDTTKVTWYPSQFQSSNAPFFPDDYKCEYQMTVPQGWYVTMVLTVNMTNPTLNGYVYVIDQLQRAETVYQSFQEQFFVIGNGNNIKLSTAKTGMQFGFSLIWKKYPATNPSMVNVNVTDTRAYILDNFDNQAIQASAGTKVSATIMPPPYDYYKQFFRGIIFIDNALGTYLGTGLQLSKARTQYVSSGKTMTVMNLASSYSLVHIEVLLQDYENTKDIVQFQGLKIDDDQDFAIVTLDPTNGPVALQSCCDDQMDTLLSVSGTGAVDVYVGGVTKSKSNVLVSYDGTTANKNLPQLFGGQSRTYVVTKSPVTFNMTRNYKYFTNTLPGRKGFLASGNFGARSMDQDVIVTLFGPVKDQTFFNTDNMFRFSIISADVVPGVSFNISCFNAGQYTRLTYNSANYPPLNSVFEWHGSQLQIDYESNSQYNKGVYLTWETYTSSGNAGLSVLFVFVIVSYFC